MRRRRPEEPLRRGGYRLRPAAAALLALALPARAEPLRVGNAVLEPLALSALPGFASDDLAAALDTFRLSCAATPPPPPQPDSVTGAPADLAAACAAAERTERGEARAFFETRFSAYRVVRPAQGAEPEKRTGLLTAYFEPELTGSLTPGPDYTAALLARPDDLVSFAPGETRPGLDPSLRAARRVGEGFEPYPDRAAIEDGAMGERARPVLYLRDAVDLLVLQIQGSGRVRLPDGTSVRALYDGKNGQRFSGIGGLIVQGGYLPLEGLTLERWTGWLRAHPEEGRRLMRRNASYVFFRLEAVTDAALGPPGAAGAALTPGRSLAVDGGLWRYGLPFWLEGRLPGGETRDTTPGRLVIAQDTGSAITGPARGDYYVGTGAKAGATAGNVRAPVGFVVLLPKPASAASAP